jgi:hypothetical protein
MSDIPCVISIFYTRIFKDPHRQDAKALISANKTIAFPLETKTLKLKRISNLIPDNARMGIIFF